MHALVLSTAGLCLRLARLAGILRVATLAALDAVVLGADPLAANAAEGSAVRATRFGAQAARLKIVSWRVLVLAQVTCVFLVRSRFRNFGASSLLAACENLTVRTASKQSPLTLSVGFHLVVQLLRLVMLGRLLDLHHSMRRSVGSRVQTEDSRPDEARYSGILTLLENISSIQCIFHGQMQ